MAVASAGIYASQHLIPDNHTNIPPLSFLLPHLALRNNSCGGKQGFMGQLGIVVGLELVRSLGLELKFRVRISG